MKTILIDNYDSFTWNVYQYLVDLGADVVVFRNDQVTLQELESLSPRNLVISPGPGKPSEAGISQEAIKHFAGKIPILGVCLGEQCMYELYGGVVTYAGELVHGKTSPVIHDGKGLYEGVPQNIECTRYHSLAGDWSTLPDCLHVTSWSARLNGDTGIGKGLVMGVRHKDYVMEGVQYHPESIASEHGRRMIANFLSWQGGYWKDLKIRQDLVRWERVGSGAGDDRGQAPSIKLQAGKGIKIADASKMNSTGSTKSPSILDVIHQQRLLDISLAKSQPGKSLAHLQRAISLNVAPPLINVKERLNRSRGMSVIAEIKRASPSKGDIDLNADAPMQALTYAQGGAVGISVLTEPKWFKGSLDDMLLVRQALQDVPDRPFVLRKDFIVDEYQVLEARLYGADTLLLIVAILQDDVLKRLLSLSRQLGMEPLVEVATAQEMKRALAVGARVIGVNNRDLHTFQVDMNRTSELATLMDSSQDTLLVALSGIKGYADVDRYQQAGARAVLVGEALMTSSNKQAFIQELMGHSLSPPTTTRPPKKALVKICGLTRLQDVRCAIELGADFLGLIFAPSPRQVSVAQARSIVEAIKGSTSDTITSNTIKTRLYGQRDTQLPWFDSIAQCLSLITRQGPLFVGVFSDTPIHEINTIVRQVGLDLVQFHGHEPADLATLCCVPVIKAYHVIPGQESRLLSDMAASRDHVSVTLLDTGIPHQQQQGGSGKPFDWSLVQQCSHPIMMAGGLTPDNIAQAIQQCHPWAVDVSSGVEQAKGIKDEEKMKEFMKRVYE